MKFNFLYLTAYHVSMVSMVHHGVRLFFRFLSLNILHHDVSEHHEYHNYMDSMETSTEMAIELTWKLSMVSLEKPWVSCNNVHEQH